MPTALVAVMQKRAAIYVRVSTDKQTVENQVAALRQIALRNCLTGFLRANPYHERGRAIVGWALRPRASLKGLP